MKKICKEPNCQNSVKTKNMCNKHYLRRHQATTKRICEMANCSNPVQAKNLCNAHYIRKRKNKPMEIPVRHHYKEGQTCAIEGCNKRPTSGGFCSTHYNRHYRVRVWQAIIEEKGDQCQACKKSFPAVVYDLHHRDPQTKNFSVGAGIGNYSFEVLLAEANKCDLLCANCHRILHFS